MTLDMIRNILGGQESECGLGYEHFARSPTLEGKPPGEAPQCPLLRVQVGEAYSDHESSLPLSMAEGNGRAKQSQIAVSCEETCAI